MILVILVEVIELTLQFVSALIIIMKKEFKKIVHNVYLKVVNPVIQHSVLHVWDLHCKLVPE